VTVNLGMLLVGAALAGQDTVADGQPLPLYLSDQRVLQVLHGSSGLLASCFAEHPPATQAWTAELQLTLSGDGTVTAAALHAAPGPASLVACLETVSLGLLFPSHDESAEGWSYRITWADGEVQPYPAATGSPRPRGPLLLALPSTLDGAQRLQIRTVLGVDPVPLMPMVSGRRGHANPSNELSPR